MKLWGVIQDVQKPEILHMVSRWRPEKHGVWVTEIRVKLRGRSGASVRRMIPRKLLDNLAEVVG